MQPFIRILLISTILIQLIACGSTKKAVTSQEIPSRTLPPLPMSTINIPVKVYMRPLLNMMDSSTAKEFTNDKWPEYTQSSCDFRYKYRFVRSPFTITCVSNKVNISFRGNYQIAGSRTVCAFDKQVSPWVSGSCGFGNEPLRRMDISIGSQLTLLPNHQVLTATKIEKLQALDKCEVTLMQNDMTKEVLDSVRASIETYTTSFDNFVQTVNNNPFLRQWRSGGTRVMPIAQYGFLNLNPTSLRISRFNVQKDTLYFSMGFSGYPQFSSDSLRLVTGLALPPISNAENNGKISAYLNANYEYKFFNQLLNDSLRNKPFEVEGRTFVIRDVNVKGTNEGKIQVDVSFSGNRSGVLHISGTPVLDTAKQVLSMPDISFSLDTKDMLVNIAKSLFRKKIIKQLQNQSVLDIAALIQKNKTAIEARINQPVTPWMSTSGKIQDIKLLGLLPQKDHLQVQALISGTIVLIGNPSPKLLGMK